jgi:hypothetical protein
LAVVLLFAPRVAAAQCDGAKRAPTAGEATAYANGYALFHRMAPPTPAGWTATDSRTESTVTFICVSDLYDFTTWSFSRTFNRSDAEMRARGDAALKQTQAVMARAEARGKANEAKLADIERRQADLAKRVEAAAATQNLAALAAISEESNKLATEREALTTDSAAESEMKAVGGAVGKDSTAQFTLTFGAKDVGTGGAFKPMPSAVGKGYRQDYAGTDGNPPADLVVPGAGFVRPSKARCTLPTKEGESSRESCRCCWYDNSQ